MSRNASLVALLLLWPVVASAQEVLPLLPEILDQVESNEVYLKGYIGSGAAGVNFDLADDQHAGVFPVLFESETDLAAQVKACTYERPCKVAAYAYLQWHGPELRLVVTSIETQARPGKIAK